MSAVALYDCLIFNDELDLLEARLEWLADRVDRVVLVEATTTFSGQPKPLYFSDNYARFARWAERVSCIVVSDLPRDPRQRWPAEVRQRNAILEALATARPDDVAIVGDVDEFPSHDTLAELRSGIDSVVALAMPSCFCKANWIVPSHKDPAPARAFPIRLLTDPHRQRNHVAPNRTMRDAGFHFTYLLDVEGVRRKFRNYGHSEMDNARGQSEQFIILAQRYGMDVFTRRLVRPLRRDELAPMQQFLAARQPDWFEFAPLPSIGERVVFKLYAEWRWRCTDHARVLRFDRAYPMGRTRLVARGLLLWGLACARNVGARWKRRLLPGTR